MRFVIDTVASPAQVQRALTDFTDRRLQIWNRTLDPRTYELRDLGETWAVARESTPRSPFWVVVRYDWSDPAVVRWTVTESSYGGAGDGVVRITPRAPSGSRLEVAWDHTGAQRQRTLLFVMRHVPMGRVVKGLWASALDDYAQAEASGVTG